MILASILFGIVTGIVSFIAALFAGQGIALALGFYVLGGMLGLVGMLAIMALRVSMKSDRRRDGSLVAARG